MRKLIVVVVSLAALLAACSDDSGSDGDAGADGTTEETGTGATGSKISIDDFAFDPATLEVEVGASVTVVNDDSATHTWTSTDGAWDSDDLASGDSFTHTFDEAGTFAYRCEIHTSMTGTVEVS